MKIPTIETTIGKTLNVWNMLLYTVDNELKGGVMYVTLRLPDGRVRTQFEGQEAKDFWKSYTMLRTNIVVVPPKPSKPLVNRKRASVCAMPLKYALRNSRHLTVLPADARKLKGVRTQLYWACNCAEDFNIISTRKHQYCPTCSKKATRDEAPIQLSFLTFLGIMTYPQALAIRKRIKTKENKS